MPNRYVNMSDQQYWQVVDEWCRVHKAFIGNGRVNTAKQPEPAPDPNKWRQKSKEAPA